MTDTEMKKKQKSCQVLTFKLAEEVYGVNIMFVKEVIDHTKVTKVPQTPDYMEGVINLRGNVVPVIDLKHKFGMGSTKKTVNTCVIIVEVDIEDEVVVLGAMADSVQEVVEFDYENIEPAPKIGTSLRTEFIEGMAKKGDDFVIILNINSVFTSGELSAITEKNMDIDTEPAEQPK